MNGRIKNLLCGVAAVLLMASMAEDAAARGTGDVARVKGKDGVWTEVPLVGVREADGGVCVPARDYLLLRAAANAVR